MVISGRRTSYIFGGVFCILSAIVAGALFLPDLFDQLFGTQLWDLQGAIVSSYDDNIIKSLSMWGLRATLIILFIVYDVSTCFRQSANSTCFRLAAIGGVLAFLLPQLLEMLSSLTDTTDLLQYENGVRIVCFVAALGTFIAGIVLRVIQKYHPDRSSTVLVFNGAFWVVASFFVAYASLMDILQANNALATISDAMLDNNSMLGLLSLFFLASGIWMLLTIKHRVWRPTAETYEEPKEEVRAIPTNRRAIPQGKIRTLADVDEEAKNASKYTSKKRTISNPYINSDNFTAIPVNRPRGETSGRKSGVEYTNSTSKTANRPNESGVDGPGFKGGNSGKKSVDLPPVTEGEGEAN